MITFRMLSDCTWREAVEIWNRGFEDYFVNLHFDEKKFNIHLSKGDLSPTHSIIAYYDKEPAGFVLNAIRQVADKKVAWNGGTGVARKFRGQGIGQAMIEKCMEIYHREQVDIATLEAIEQNLAAIALYEKMGYSITDNLHFYTLKKNVPDNYCPLKSTYHIERSSSKAVMRLPFWRKWTPWQTQLVSLPDAESVIISDNHGKPVGYALCKDTFNDQGIPIQTVLFQSETLPDVSDQKELNSQLLANVFRFDVAYHYRQKDYTCSTYNLIATDQVLEILRAWGFQQQMGQVWMEKTLIQ